ncbi:hypothetical protein EGM88_05590 [Aureibaculum marinum]|uniref:Uncharacterized protein n=1 Tax=Aureibaculum marinum TaxID=2487930 RepID=A0A3N4NQK7_9FLAO|nr:hypothetical protein [Aureibaculum marinum]RPD98662.1 hypothetical protein EGM88_05590 [Aureibaculum marinum]
MNNNIQQNNIFKTLQIIYGAFVLGVVIVTIVSFLLIENPSYEIELSNVFTIVVVVVTFGGLFLSDFLYKSLLSKIVSNQSLNSKLAQYQTATLVKGACLEAPAMLAIAVAFTSNNVTFLLISLFIAVIMYLKFPKKEKFKEEVTLNFEDKTKFDRL